MMDPMTAYTEQRHLHYTASQLFDLVADIERYPDFLPWVADAGVVRREENRVWVDLTIGTGFIRKRFASEAVLDRPKRIDITSHDRLFEYFEQNWLFEPAANGGTIVGCRIAVRLRSPLLQAVMGAQFDDAATVLVDAFRHRARQVYGADGRPGARTPTDG